jgi:UDP-N-acetylglucosamine 2-epimerase (non-hydrolysing)
MVKYLAIVGTRPQYIKLAPLYHEILKNKDEIIIVDTGQHYDNEMSKFVLDNLGIQNINHNLGIKEYSHGIQTGKMISSLEPIVQKYQVDHCLVFGDTNSTIAGAIVSRKLKIQTSHIEAGIRMKNIDMAEEINRRIADSICNFLFAPSQIAYDNLFKENPMGELVFSGDIMYDAIKMFEPHLKGRKDIDKVLGNKKNEILLMTLHRAENVDNKEKMTFLFDNLGKIKNIILFPCHPRTRKRIAEFDLVVPENIIVIRPLPYLELLNYIRSAILVLTDSGGLQKEAYYLGKRSIFIYPETPWPELEKLGVVTLANENDIYEKINLMINKDWIQSSEMPYGKGNATEIILQSLNSS